MKIGDLVQLSAYGKKRVRARWIDPTDVGLVMKIIEYGNGQYPPEYVVRWVKSKYRSGYHSWNHERSNTRADLKYVK